MAAKTRQKKKRSPPNALADHAPLEHQRRHKVDPVVPVKVKIGASIGYLNGKLVHIDREVVQTVRRQVDARLWERFDIEQEAAALQIYSGWRAATIGVGMKISDPARTPGSGSTAASIEANVALRRTWHRWTMACADERINSGIAIDILCLGCSAREVDDARGLRKGTAVAVLMQALDQWCLVRHWKSDGRTRPVI